MLRSSRFAFHAAVALASALASPSSAHEAEADGDQVDVTAPDFVQYRANVAITSLPSPAASPTSQFAALA